MVIPAGIAVCVVAWFVLYGGLNSLMAYVRHTPQRVIPAHSQTNSSLLPALVPRVPGLSPQTNLVPLERKLADVPRQYEEEQIFMSGYALLDGVWHVALSDGRIVLSTDPEFEVLTERGLKYGGHYYHRVLTVSARVPHDPVKSTNVAAPVQVPSPMRPVEPSVAQPDLNPWVGRPVNVHWQDGTVTHHKITDSSTALE